jgi:hypothetical protein
MRVVAGRQDRQVSNGNVFLAHNASHSFTADGPNKGVHILERPLHLPDEPPRLPSGESGCGRAQVKNFLLPLNREMQQRTCLRKDGREGDACLVHGNTQSLTVAYPVLLTGDAIWCRTKEGVKVGTSRIQDERDVEPGGRGYVPYRTLPWDVADASRRPYAHVEL